MGRQAAARNPGRVAAEKVAAMSRAHGNTSEYAPFFAILFLLVHYACDGQPGMLLDIVMVVATVSRVSSAYGIAHPLPGDVKNFPRYYGAVGTYATGLILSVSILFLSYD